jgi:hypothetical protein
MAGRSTAIRWLLLVILLGVFAFQARSCVTKIEEKKLAAQRQNALHDARTAAEPSPFPMDPIARRRAIADQLRLRPDGRFLGAVAEIVKLTHGETAAVGATFDGKTWVVANGREELGRLPEIPDYTDLMKVLVDLGRRRLEAAPVSGTLDARSEAALAWEPEARKSLPDALSRWARGDRSRARLHAAARAAAALVFYQTDTLQIDDQLASQALALAALDEAAGTNHNGVQSVLAAGLRYGQAARNLIGTAQGDESFRAYLTGDDAQLNERAILREASPQDRYLRLRRAADRYNDDELNEFLDSYHGTERVELAVVSLLLRQRQMRHYAPIAKRLPVFVLAAAEGLPITSVPSSSEAEAVETAASQAVVKLGVDPRSLSGRLEQGLAKVDEPVRGYLRALWVAALQRQGEFWTEGQADRAGAEAFARWLASESSPTVQRFGRWFAARTTLMRGDPVSAFAAAEQGEAMSGGAAGSLLVKALDVADFASPKILRAARAVVPRLDSRVSHRVLLGQVAWGGLQDLRVAFSMLKSASHAEYRIDDYLREWFAQLRGDVEGLRAIGADHFVDRSTRLSAWEHLEELAPAIAEAGLRQMLDEDSNDGDAALELGKFLRVSGRLDDARTVLQNWLRPNDVPGIPAANVRGALARYAYLSGNYEEGLRVVAPALQIGVAVSYAYAALNLAGLGKSADARKMADALLERYPKARWLAAAVEVEWQLGDLDAAGRRLAQPPVRLRTGDVREEVGEPFVRKYGDKPKEARAAAKALQKAGVEVWNVEELAVALDLANRPEAAVEVRDVIEARGGPAQMLRLRMAKSMRKSRGDEAANTWLRNAVPIHGDGEGRLLALLAFREGMPEVTWDPVPDPKGDDETAETTWMLRAAAVAEQGAAAPPERVKSLRAHYSAATSALRQTQIGRYLIGELPESELAKLVTNEPATCEVPYYFGVRAEGEKRLADAADWYRVALECGRVDQAEYVFAANRLYRWRASKNPLALLSLQQ